MKMRAQGAGPLLMFAGIGLLAAVSLEALEVGPAASLGWPQATNLMLAQLGAAAYGIGFLIDLRAEGTPAAIDREREELDSGRSEMSRAALAASHLFAALMFIGGKSLLLDYDAGKLLPDTISYVQVAQAELGSADFWAGSRPFTVPLFYKLLGVTEANFMQAEVLDRIGRVQAGVSGVAWLGLAAAMAAVARGRRLGLVSFAAVLMFGLNLHVSQWDRLPLSESLSTSFFAATLAWAILGIALRAELARRGPWLRSGYFGLVVLLTLFFSFSRDSNAVAVILFALAGAVWAGWRLRDRTWWAPWLLAAFAAMLVGCLAQSASIQTSGRWKTPFYHIMRDRILADDRARAFFAARGLPREGLFQELLGLERREFVATLDSDGRYQGVSDWIENRGRIVYLQYIANDLPTALLTPVRERDGLLNPVSTEYRHQEAVTPTWLALLTSVMFPRATAVLLALGVIIVLVLTHLSWRGRWRDRWLIPIGLLATSYALMLVAWYGDSIEIERHAYQAALQFRLALLLLGLWLLDGELRLFVGGSLPAGGRVTDAGGARAQGAGG